MSSSQDINVLPCLLPGEAGLSSLSSGYSSIGGVALANLHRQLLVQLPLLLYQLLLLLLQQLLLLSDVLETEVFQVQKAADDLIKIVLK